MECNKEEAIKAKDIAEKNMQNRDFIGARKMALKARQLFPDLENISQMLTVCEVHCSAGVKVNGEMDWYGILQVEATADDSSIKKQYRKLALVLHPDKNQFTGAEAAFKLIGEAHMTLSDTTKRYSYDMRRNANIRSAPTRQQPQHLRKTAAYATNNFTTVNFNGINQRQPSPSASSQTFWTMCPNCGMRYQYWLSIKKKALRCQSCQTAFIAEELTQNAMPSGINSTHSWHTFGNPQGQVPVQQANFVNQQSQSGNAASSTGFPGRVGGRPGTNSENVGEPANNASDGKVNIRTGVANKKKHESAKFTDLDKGKKAAKPSIANAGQKRVRKMIVDTSDSDSTDSEDITVDEDGIAANLHASLSGPRRSTRLKQKVTYVEEGGEDEDDFVHPPSNKKLWESSSADEHDETLSDGDANGIDSGVERTNVFNENIRNKQKEDGLHDEGPLNGNEDNKDGLGSGIKEEKSGLEANTFSYPDPEFCDFEKFRSVDQFDVDQIWAVYDDVDGMPRFYARIRKIYSPRFRVRFNWLEHNPRNELETAWSEEKLPVACGNFIQDKLDSGDQLMFSHVISWEKGKRRNSYDIYPRKGDVWALFKSWSIRWSSDGDRNRNYEYEVAEVLSDFAAGTEISVIPLVKVEGFVSVFMRVKEKEADPVVIPASEILRFSHNVPACRLTGEEREGVPEGSFELDPASLPANFMETFPSVRVDECCDPPLNETKANGVHKMENRHGHLFHEEGIRDACGGKDSQQNKSGVSNAWKNVPSEPKHQKVEMADKDNIVILDTDDESISENSLSPKQPVINQICDYPTSDFHNFEDAKTVDKLLCSQVWALYSDIDKYPKYYALVKNVEIEELKVHVAWLEACPTLKVERRWLEEDMPISCGTFKVVQNTIEFEGTEAFSHPVQAKPNGRKNKYVILPSCGEIWAIYKNWKAGWRRFDLENCEYDVVEIHETTSSGIKVRLLSKVDGYIAVFKPERDGNHSTAMDIPIEEYSRFSHQIPAFCLTDEGGGVLRGYWELDPASLPDSLLT